MNIQPRPISMQPSLETIKATYNNQFLHLAVSHYPAGTVMDMNNFLLVSFRKHEDYPLHQSIHLMYRVIKCASQPNQYFSPDGKVGMIAYYDYTSSKSGKDKSQSSLPSQDHVHAIIFARNAQESNDIKNTLIPMKGDLHELHIAGFTSLNKSLMHVMSYISKGFGHQYSINGSDKYDPIVLPHFNERHGIKSRLDAVQKSRLSNHSAIQDYMVLS